MSKGDGMDFYFKISKYKSFEIQLDRFTDGKNWFNFHFKWTKKEDHAGLSLFLELFTVFLDITIHDTRHWDLEKQCWCIYKK